MDERWYYELTRELLNNEEGAEQKMDQLVRIEWLNLEEATIYQLEVRCVALCSSASASPLIWY